MALAYAAVLRDAGYSSHRYMWVSVTDIDPMAAGMAYIQLSLSGVAGEIVIGNSLTMSVGECYIRLDIIRVTDPAVYVPS